MRGWRWKHRGGSNPPDRTRPSWRNLGRLARLRTSCPQGRVGSNPTDGTMPMKLNWSSAGFVNRRQRVRLPPSAPCPRSTAAVQGACTSLTRVRLLPGAPRRHRLMVGPRALNPTIGVRFSVATPGSRGRSGRVARPSIWRQRVQVSPRAPSGVSKSALRLVYTQVRRVRLTYPGPRAAGSAARASPRHGGDRWFESNAAHHGEAAGAEMTLAPSSRRVRFSSSPPCRRSSKVEHLFGKQEVWLRLPAVAPRV